MTLSVWSPAETLLKVNTPWLLVVVVVWPSLSERVTPEMPFSPTSRVPLALDRIN